MPLHSQRFHYLVQLQAFSGCRLTAGIGSSTSSCLLSQPGWTDSLEKVYTLGKRAWGTVGSWGTWGNWTKRSLLSDNPFSLVPSAVVITFPPSLMLQIPISCSPALQNPSHFLLQPMSRWRRMSSAWWSHSCSLFAPWDCGLPDGL